MCPVLFDFNNYYLLILQQITQAQPPERDENLASYIKMDIFGCQMPGQYRVRICSLWMELVSL